MGRWNIETVARETRHCYGHCAIPGEECRLRKQAGTVKVESKIELCCRAGAFDGAREPCLGQENSWLISLEYLEAAREVVKQVGTWCIVTVHLETATFVLRHGSVKVAALCRVQLHVVWEFMKVTVPARLT